jgi:hypothetical protein
LILFGGRDSTNAPVAGTWQWLSGCWTKLSLTTNPSARSGMVATYDAAHQVVVAFGGDARLPEDASLTFQFDTWIWNGTTWAEASTSGPPLIVPSIAFDPKSAHVILTGANGRTDAVNETWSWTGSSWQQLHPATAPPARIQSSIAEDPSAGQVVLFGGRQTNAILGDTWTWDGSTWLEKQISGPSIRSDAAMAFDQQSGLIVLFGGDGNAGPLTDSWTWDGTTWASKNPSHAGPEFSSAVETPNHVLLVNGAGDTAMWTGLDWAIQ